LSSNAKKEFFINNFSNLSIPIPWKYYVYILINKYGFEMENKKGSCRAFIRENERFIADEPHGKGDKVVSKEDRKKAIRALIRLGALRENGDET